VYHCTKWTSIHFKQVNIHHMYLKKVQSSKICFMFTLKIVCLRRKRKQSMRIIFKRLVKKVNKIQVASQGITKKPSRMKLHNSDLLIFLIFNFCQIETSWDLTCIQKPCLTHKGKLTLVRTSLERNIQWNRKSPRTLETWMLYFDGPQKKQKNLCDRWNKVLDLICTMWLFVPLRTHYVLNCDEYICSLVWNVYQFVVVPALWYKKGLLPY